MRWHRRQDAAAQFEATAGAAYAELIEAELRDERIRRGSIERRGFFITTAAGTTAGLALTAVPLLLGAGLTIPAESIWFGGFAAIFFAITALSGNRANAPTNFDVLKAISLGRVLTPEFFQAGRSIGSRRAAEVRLEELVSARKANTRKATWLNLGFATHLLGILCVGAAAVLAVGFRLARE